MAYVAKKNTHYIVMSTGMGDSLCALAFLREYKRKVGYKHITVVGCASALRQTCILYENLIDDVIYIDKKEVGSLKCFSLSLIGQKCCAFLCQNRITVASYYCHFSQRIVWDNPYVSLTDFVRTFLYQLEPDTVLERPKIPATDITAFISKYSLQQGKTVLMNPFANTVSLDVSGAFEKIAQELLKSGYTVATLTADTTQKPISGTTAIICSLPEAYHLAEFAGTVVALRSGFLDYIVFSNCKIISVEDGDYGRREFYKLEKWRVNNDCHSLIYENIQETSKKVLGLIGIES